MYKSKTLCVVIPAYNEEKAIKKVVTDFIKHKYVDRVIVVNNNSDDNTSEYAKDSGAQVIKETKRGYGNALKAGLSKVKEDLIIMTEADNTFFSYDLDKLLSYEKDADLVLGTRTVEQLITAKANMGLFLRFGNIFIAKFLQLLYGPLRYTLSDVGCTFRLISRINYRKLSLRLNSAGPQFSPEMMLEAAKSKFRIVQVPVNYGGRIGNSKISMTKIKSFILGIKMMALILRKSI